MEQRRSRRSLRRTGNKCVNCAHIKFDELWGEHTKCLLHKCRIRDAGAVTDCKDFKKQDSTK